LSGQDDDFLSFASPNDNDRAFVALDGNFFYFVFDAENTLDEQLLEEPYVVYLNTGDGAWVQQENTPNGLMTILAEVLAELQTKPNADDTIKVVEQSPLNISGLAKESKQLPDNHQVTVSNPTDTSSLATEATLQDILEKEPENPALSLSYNDGQLVTISKVLDGTTYLKTLSYSNGVLTAVSKWEEQ
jgi:hypothetical protein